MIKHLSIKNLLLIDNIDFFFNDGLCVLTGETGAGKSMILDSLSLLSGGRVKSALKPINSKISNVLMVFDVSNFPKTQEKLEKLDIEFDDEIIIRRTITFDGKSKAFINDNLVSANSLKEISRDLIEIESQFSEQGLLDSSTHLKTLDEYGNYKNELDYLAKLWSQLKEMENEFSNAETEQQKIKNEKESFEFDINELTKLNPKKNEIDNLIQKKKWLQNSTKVYETLNTVVSNLTSEQPPGIEGLISKNLNLLHKIKDILDQDSQKAVESLDSILIEITEITKTFENILENNNEDSSLEEIDERIYLYKKISRKHNYDENKLDELLSDLKKRLVSSENYEENYNKLRVKLVEIKKRFEDQANKISNLRKVNAQQMDNLINNELPSLKLEHAEFKTFISENAYSEKGKDKIFFKIKTNPTSEMHEIKKISSGGELCRFALAIKVISQRNNLSLIVFDEVDSGIGGSVSTAVGERLRKLGQNRQVLVVTHSPQVAVLGNDHFVVKKELQNKTTEISVKKLSYKDKVNEIARMLSGKKITQEALLAAKRLLDTSS